MKVVFVVDVLVVPSSSWSVLMTSPAVPPNTIASPVPVVMLSLPPMPGAVVWTSPTVIGSVPKRSASEEAARIMPLSPRMTLVPEPPVIVSLPWPPTTIALPEPRVIWSLPPSVGSVETTASISLESLSAP